MIVICSIREGGAKLESYALLAAWFAEAEKELLVQKKGVFADCLGKVLTETDKLNHVIDITTPSVFSSEMEVAALERLPGVLDFHSCVAKGPYDVKASTKKLTDEAVRQQFYARLLFLALWLLTRYEATTRCLGVRMLKALVNSTQSSFAQLEARVTLSDDRSRMNGDLNEVGSFIVNILLRSLPRETLLTVGTYVITNGCKVSVKGGDVTTLALILAPWYEIVHDPSVQELLKAEDHFTPVLALLFETMVHINILQKKNGAETLLKLWKPLLRSKWITERVLCFVLKCYKTWMMKQTEALTDTTALFSPRARDSSTCLSIASFLLTHCHSEAYALFPALVVSQLKQLVQAFHFLSEERPTSNGLYPENLTSLMENLSLTQRENETICSEAYFLCIDVIGDCLALDPAPLVPLFADMFLFQLSGAFYLEEEVLRSFAFFQTGLLLYRKSFTGFLQEPDQHAKYTGFTFDFLLKDNDSAGIAELDVVRHYLTRQAQVDALLRCSMEYSATNLLTSYAQDLSLFWCCFSSFLCKKLHQDQLLTSWEDRLLEELLSTDDEIKLMRCLLTVLFIEEYRFANALKKCVSKSVMERKCVLLCLFIQARLKKKGVVDMLWCLAFKVFTVLSKNVMRENDKMVDIVAYTKDVQSSVVTFLADALAAGSSDLGLLTHHRIRCWTLSELLPNERSSLKIYSFLAFNTLVGGTARHDKLSLKFLEHMLTSHANLLLLLLLPRFVVNCFTSQGHTSQEKEIILSLVDVKFVEYLEAMETALGKMAQDPVPSEAEFMRLLHLIVKPVVKSVATEFSIDGSTVLSYLCQAYMGPSVHSQHPGPQSTQGADLTLAALWFVCAAALRSTKEVFHSKCSVKTLWIASAFSAAGSNQGLGQKRFQQAQHLCNTANRREKFAVSALQELLAAMSSTGVEFLEQQPDPQSTSSVELLEEILFLLCLQAKSNKTAQENDYLRRRLPALKCVMEDGESLLNGVLKTLDLSTTAGQ